MFLNSTSKKLLVGCLSFGFVMGMVFPIYAGFFASYKTGMELYFKAGCIAAGLVVGVINYYLARILVYRQINKVAKRLGNISGSEADLTKSLQIASQDELGDLADNFNLFISKLKIMIGTIIGDTETLFSSSFDLSTISKQLSVGAEETSDMSNSVAVAAEQMSANMDTVATTAEHVSESMRTVADAASDISDAISNNARNTEKARQIVGKAVFEANNASTKINELKELAQNIDKVIGSIFNISQKTNLLALNATVEAARAGKAGKGFSVVANEVKTLSDQTSVATEEIKRFVENIQNTTQESVIGLAEILKLVEEVNITISDIATSMSQQSSTTDGIGSTVSRAFEDVSLVTANIKESSISANKVALDIISVKQSANEISDSSVEVQDSAEKLNSLSKALASLFSQFQT